MFGKYVGLKHKVLEFIILSERYYTDAIKLNEQIKKIIST